MWCFSEHTDASSWFVSKVNISTCQSVIISIYKKDRIIEQPRFEETLKNHLAQPSMRKRVWMRLSRTLSLYLDGDSTTCLGRLFHWFTVLTVKKKKIFLISSQKLSQYPLTLVYSMWQIGKRKPSSSL